MKNLILVFVITGFYFSGFSQNPEVTDSLKADLATLRSLRGTTSQEVLPSDTLIIKTLVYLSEAYDNNDLAAAMRYAQEALRQSKEIDYLRGMAMAYHSIGSISDDIGDHQKAIVYLKKSIEIRKKIGVETDVAASYLNIGHVYEGIGNFSEAFSGIRRFL